MGEMADYHLDSIFADHMCFDCGRDIDWCQCDGPLHPPHDCDGEEVTRVNKKTGQKFVGCSKFPDCKWSRSLS